MQIKSNRLLLGILAFNILYWYGGPFIHGNRISNATALGLFLSGLAMMVIYTRGMLDVVIFMRRDDQDAGSHIAVFASWLGGFGAITTALFNWLWVDAGRPRDWVGTVFSNFGSVAIATAFALLAWAPYSTRQANKAPRQSVLVILAVIAVITAYWFGSQNSTAVDTTADAWYPIDRPRCMDNQPIWGVSESKIFHTPTSAYRSQVIPDRCFATELEARLKGYRPPN